MIPTALIPILGRLILVSGIFLAGWWVSGWRWEVKYRDLQAEHTAFVNGVAREGEQAKTKNALIALSDLKKKERVDEENRRRHTADINTILRLRRAADRARRSPVPPAPAGSSRPDLLCLDRSEYIREDGEVVSRLREGARRLADEGTAATIDLNTSKIWAQGNKDLTD